MTIRTVRLLVAMICACALFATACGGGSETSGESTAAQSAEPTAAEASGSSSSSGSSEPSESSGSTESPIADLLGIPISDDDEMEQFFSELQRNAERKISECMLNQGFQYTVVDYSGASGLAVGVEDGSREYVETYGFGITANPFEEAFESFQDFEDPNREYVATLSEGEGEAYQAALAGELPDFESDDIQSFTPGGCQGEAYEEVFSFGLVFEQFGDQLEEIGEQFDADPRIVQATAGWGSCMGEAGYQFSEVDDARDDIERRYQVIVDAPGAFEDSDEVTGTIEVEGPGTSDVFFGPGTLTPAAQEQVDELAIEERAVALASWECDAPLRDISDDIQFEYEQKFVDQYGSEIQAALDN